MARELYGDGTLITSHARATDTIDVAPHQRRSRAKRRVAFRLLPPQRIPEPLMSRSLIATSILALALTRTVAAQTAQAPVVFTGVSVIPMDREEVLSNQTVIV